MRFTFALLAALLVTTPAHAVKIKNLTKSTQVVVVDQGGARSEAIIKPGDSYRRHGPDITLIMPGQRPIHSDPHDEYAIWPDGKLIIQRRHKAKGREH